MDKDDVALARSTFINLPTSTSAVLHSVLHLSRGGSQGRRCPSNFGQNVVGAGCPEEGFGIDVVMGDIQIDGQLQLGHVGEAIAADALVADVAEEALDHVRPRSAGRREVRGGTRMAGQPLLHRGVAVRGVVVHDQMQAQVLGRTAVDQPQELQPFAVPVPRLAHRDHAAVQASRNGNILVCPTLGGQQHHERSLLEPGLNRSVFGDHTQLELGALIQFNRLGNPHRSSLLERLSVPTQLSSITSRALY